MLCSITAVEFHNITLTAEGIPVPKQSPSVFSRSQTLATTDLLFFSYGFAFSSYFIQMNHEICGHEISCLGLSLSIVFSRCVHVVACSNTSFLFMAELYECHTFRLSIYQLMDCQVISTFHTCKWCCYKHSCILLVLAPVFSSFGCLLS